MKIRESISLIIWIAVFQSVGFLLGMMTQDNLSIWYAGLNKSSLTPPGYVFSIVWPLLYVLLAFVGWALWRDRDHLRQKSILPLFFMQIFMNWAWTPLFFQLHWLGISFLWLASMVVMNGVMMLMMKSEKRELALSLIPYWLWLMFAAYLNGIIWLLN